MEIDILINEYQDINYYSINWDGLDRNDAINEFISKALDDKNELLVIEASTI